MGVHGLWELLAPVGRRVSVESLGSRKLAIDASIWIIQFMKAMRDDRGDMIRNAHLLGFFRRICKLLFLRIKPVFVFDGGTPALKRRTVIARRRQREQAQSRIRKTAEKLLLNHLRTRKLDEIAGKSAPSLDSNDMDVSTFKNGMNASEDFSSIVGDLQGSAEPLQDDEVQELNNLNEVASGHLEEEDEEEEELVYLPSTEGKIDPAVLASLPASMQLDLLVQMREQLVAENRHKFQKVAKAPSSFSQLQIEAYLKTVAFRRGINEAQKAAAVKGVGGVPSTRIASETNREFIFSTSYQGDKTALTGEGGDNPGLKPPEPKVQPPAVTTSSLLSSNSSSLPLKDAPLSTEVDGSEKPDSSVQTYVDEKGRTRVSRVRGMGVRMTRDLQWNLYLMKDVENRQTREEDDVSAYAESLVNNGDGELFHRLMMGDDANLSKQDGDPVANQSTGSALSGIPSKQNGDPVQPLEANQSIGSTEGAGQRAVVNPYVVPQVSSIQITFNSNDDAEDEDLGLFQNLVAEAPLDKAQESKPAAGENDDDDCEWEDGDFQGAKEVDPGFKGITAADQQTQTQTGTQSQTQIQTQIQIPIPIQTPTPTPTPTQTGNDLAYGGDGDAELARAIQESLAEHDRLRDAQRGDSEDTGLSDDSDTGESGESEVEWEDGSGAVAVPAVGYNTVAGLTLTQEELELQEATRRSLNDVASWRALPQLSIREPVDGGAKMLSGEPEAVFVDRNLQMDSEEARIARERARKGKAVADETTVLPPVGAIRSTEGFVQEKVDGRGYVQAQPQNIPVLDASQIGKEDFYVRNLSHAHGDKNVEKPGIVQMAELPGEVKLVPEAVKLVPDTVEKGAKAPNPNIVKPSGMAMEDMLREAEETDMAKEREAMLQHEAALLAEREALARDEAELQAALEMEQQELREGIEKERELLREEEAELRDMQKKNERNADSVTSEMFAECQELLQMFGIPYVIAPMEAEAQCAFLDAEKLVDGVVTDDVDVFLFGGRNVYKNIFDDRKYVETYYMKDIETDLGLTREKLIQMALLLGSDYTEGISGIGIVNAIEVVNAFDEEDGLRKFKEMVEAVDLSLLGLEGKGSKRKGKAKGKKGGTDDDDDAAVEKGDTTEGSEAVDLRQEAFMENHRAVSKNWKIPESFPSEAVVAEYIGPRVDKSKQAFSWGRPDLEALRKFCYERFSWNKDKADELLLSVLKEYDRQETQLRLDAFYSFNQRFAKVRSARIQKALRGTTGRLSKEMVDIPSGPPAKKPRQKKSAGKQSAEEIIAEEEADLNTMEGSGIGSEELVSGQGRGKKKRETGSGRGRGRARGRGGGRGRGGRNTVELEEDGSSAHTSETDHDVEETETDRGLKRKSDDQILPVRRSSRARRSKANYEGPAGSDEKSGSEDDVSLRSESPDPLQPARTESNIDDQAAAGSSEQGTDLEAAAAPLPKLYLFSGGGFCLPDEEAEISAALQEHDHGVPNEGSNAVGSGAVSSGVPTEDETETRVGATVDANAGSGLRALPFLRKKRPPKQP